MRRSCERNARAGWLGLGFGLMAAIVLGVSPSAGAVDSRFNVSVCGADIPPASIDIAEPRDDSVVGQPTQTFRGTVSNSSQIEISIDGTYVTTLAIGSGQTSFETDLTLSPGNHTIDMTATAICGGTDGTDSVVITYQVATQPSNGSGTPTELDGTVTLDGQPVVPEEEGEEIGETARRMPIVDNIVNMVSDFASVIGLRSTVTSNGASSVGGVARVGLTVVALTSVVMAGTIAPVAAQALPGISEVFDASSHRSMLYFGWVIRGIGVLVMTLAYFL